MRRSWVAAVLACALAGCAGRTAYVPVDGVREPETGQVLAHRAIPAAAPRGEVQVTSFGVTPIEMTKGARAMPFLHVRLAVANQDGRGPWLLDVRHQMVELRGVGRSRPALINTSGRATSPPELGVDTHGMRVVDLFYALPRRHDTVGDVPDFAFTFRVRLEDGTAVEEQAFFVRGSRKTNVAEERSAPTWSRSLASIGVGWGELWWYDPQHASVGFARSRVPHDTYPFLMSDERHAPYRVLVSPEAAPRSLANAASNTRTVR